MEKVLLAAMSYDESNDAREPTSVFTEHGQLVQASHERNLIRERIRTGLKAARTCGRKGGRPKKLQAKELKQSGLC
jgi:DNA invertase Pin-like site-specific DNA recombinase